jgi:hypothetical protein
MAALVIAELVLRLAFPQESLSPRWNFSPQYCSLPFPSTRMVHERPGQWRFVYTINQHGYRGRDVAPDGKPARPTVVVLGDSYSFGQGVNDGEEYSAVLARAFAGSMDVINLGVPGWGLTQEIRRFHDFGARYKPTTVVLQFSANDPEDNLTCPVTMLRKGQLKFQDTDQGIFWIKQYLSRSIIQKSQVYCLFRNTMYRMFAAATVARNRAALATPSRTGEMPVEEKVYTELLNEFAEELSQNGIRLIFLTVNGQVAEFPRIQQDVRRLEQEGRLRFIDAANWLEGFHNYGSPEGHQWGAPAQKVIGLRLAQLIRLPN